MKEFDFRRARELAQAVEGDDPLHRIGTYNERSQHRTLKFVLEEDSSFHEVPVGAYVADICRDGHIYEVQTCGFKKLWGKLKCFTEDYCVTVVYPVPAIKTVMWVEPSSGEISQGRRVRKNSAKYKILSELIHIHEFLGNERFKIQIFETEVFDYRLLDGRGADKKVKATKSDTVPVDILKVTDIRHADDLKRLLPFEADTEYNRSDIEKLIQLKGRNLSCAIKTLVLLGIMEKQRKDKNKVYYKLRAF